MCDTPRRTHSQCKSITQVDLEIWWTHKELPALVGLGALEALINAIIYYISKVSYYPIFCTAIHTFEFVWFPTLRFSTDWYPREIHHILAVLPCIRESLRVATSDSLERISKKMSLICITSPTIILVYIQPVPMVTSSLSLFHESAWVLEIADNGGIITILTEYPEVLNANYFSSRQE